MERKMDMKEVIRQIKSLTRWEFNFQFGEDYWQYKEVNLTIIWDMETQSGCYILGPEEVTMIRSWSELENIVEQAIPELY